MEKIEELDLSIKSKQEDGKNDKDAIDRKLYELRNFMKLAMDNNPNILEIIFVPDKNIVEINEFGKELLSNAHLFPWKGCKQKFLGYAFSQKHKMYIKRENISDLRVGYDFFFEELEKGLHTRLLGEYRGSGPFEWFDNHCRIGDVNFHVKMHIKDVVSKLQNRIDKFGHRTQLVDDYGYDVKFASHLIRLMLEGKELLQTSRISFPLKEKDLLREIRDGKYSLEEIIKMSEEYEKEIEDLVLTSKLPSKPRYDEIDKLLISMVKRRLTL